MDLVSGFHQIGMGEKHRDKTVFSTENEHYEFLCMPFGLKKPPLRSNNILRGMRN